MSTPTYRRREALQRICDEYIPDQLNDLWAALEAAWEAQEEAEDKIGKLEERITELEEE